MAGEAIAALASGSTGSQTGACGGGGLMEYRLQGARMLLGAPGGILLGSDRTLLEAWSQR